MLLIGANSRLNGLPREGSSRILLNFGEKFAQVVFVFMVWTFHYPPVITMKSRWQSPLVSFLANWKPNPANCMFLLKSRNWKSLRCGSGKEVEIWFSSILGLWGCNICMGMGNQQLNASLLPDIKLKVCMQMQWKKSSRVYGFPFRGKWWWHF